jgi:hypothetical protein
MRKRRVVRWVLRIAFGLLALALLLPGLPWRLGLEHTYQGLPTSYWAGAVKRWTQRKPAPLSPITPWVDRLLTYLGPGSRPAVLNGNPAAVPVLIDLLDQKDLAVRRAAVVACGETGPPAAPASMRLVAILGNTPEERSRPAEDRNEEFPALAYTALGQIGAGAGPALENGLRAGEALVRRRTASLLGRIRPASAASVPALIEAFRDEDDFVLASVRIALSEIGPEAVPLLTRALTDPDGHLRRHAAVVLGYIGPAALSAAPALEAALVDTDPEVRQAAAAALAVIDPDANRQSGGETAWQPRRWGQ